MSRHNLPAAASSSYTPQSAFPLSSRDAASSTSSHSAQKPSLNGSPVRPARSRMRDQAPIRTTPGTYIDRQSDVPVSPISPLNPEPPSLFSDPFAADRSHRTELRAQTKAALQAPDTSRDKLRNVVGAFMSAGKVKEEPRRNVRRDDGDLFSSSGKFSDIDNVLQRIRKDWPLILESDFSSSTLALSLLNSSRLQQFMELHDALSAALQASVQAHFQSFAASLPAHDNFLATLGRAQQQIRLSKDALREARDGIGSRSKTELTRVRARERQVREILQILDTIDNLKQIPDQLESLIGDKKYLSAASLLMDNLKILGKPEIAGLGAVSDLRNLLLAQESNLTDILIEELHSQLYLKHFDAEIRLRADDRLDRFLASASDEVVDAQGDPFRFIQALLEALAILGKLSGALDIIAQRVSSEIYTLIDTTLDEVEERSIQPVEQLEDTPAFSLAVTSSPRHSAILKDLMWTLYAKLAAVLEGHRVVYEVSRWISSRRDFKDANQKLLSIPVLEVWKPIQQEVRTILRNYLVDAIGSTLDRQSILSVNEILRDGQPSRDRQKSLFRFSDTDNRAVNSHFQAIESTLKTTLPGLSTSNDTLDENLGSGNHRNLIPANPFNVTTLFEPTINFIERAAAIAPPGFENEPKAFGAVLEDFVVQVYLPQLDEKVTAAFHSAVSDTRTDVADRPPLRSSMRVMDLIHGLCFMLQTSPFHQENYSRLITGVIVQFYQQCSARFKELAGTPSSDTALPASLAQRENLIACLTDVRAVLPSDFSESSLTGQREIKLESELLGITGVVESQLINSKRNFEALCQLSQSLRWFIDALLDLQSIAEDAPTVSVEPKLPLTREMAQRFEAIIQTYEQLAEMILNTLRLEIRCRVICNINAAFKKGDFSLDSEALEPDPDVVDAAGHLATYDSLSQKTLSDPDHRFIFRGLSQLVDHLFIHNARSVKTANAAGVQKIRRNILSLQQTLRAIQDDDGVLSRSIEYWDMYEKGPKEMLERLKTSKPIFTFDDYNVMLNLQCKTDSSQAPSSELNTYLIDLHALSMSIEGWEIGEG